MVRQIRSSITLSVVFSSESEEEDDIQATGVHATPTVTTGGASAGTASGGVSDWQEAPDPTTGG